MTFEDQSDESLEDNLGNRRILTTTNAIDHCWPVLCREIETVAAKSDAYKFSASSLTSRRILGEKGNGIGIVAILMSLSAATGMVGSEKCCGAIHCTSQDLLPRDKIQRKTQEPLQPKVTSYRFVLSFYFFFPFLFTLFFPALLWGYD